MSEPFNAQATEDAIQILADRITSKPGNSMSFVGADGIARKYLYNAIMHLEGQLRRYLRNEDTPS